MVQNLRIVAASFCLVASLALAALWVRSYSYSDALQGPPLAVSSWHGRFSVWRYHELDTGIIPPARWFVSSLRGDFAEGLSLPLNVRRVFPPDSHVIVVSGKKNWNECLLVSFPHWFPVLISGAMVVILKPKPRLRFAMRDVLVFTTVVAVMLGGLLALLRATTA